MDFLKPGTEVELLKTTQKGIIIGVCIRGIENFTIEYHVQWMNTSGIQEAWIYSFNVKEYICPTKKAGFVDYELLNKKLNQ